MVEWTVRLLALGFAALLTYELLQQRYTFKVRISAGKARVVRGKVTAAFVERITEVCQEFDVTRGWVGGVAHGKRITLHFSRSFAQAPRQRLRNEWLVIR
jgi:hypothetical protein